MAENSKSCFVCQISVTSTTEVIPDDAYNNFIHLCQLLRLSSRFQSTWKASKTAEIQYFCQICESQIREGLDLIHNIEILQRNVDNIRKNLQKCISFPAVSSNENIEKSGTDLRKMLSQCWSKCEVRVDLLPDEETSKYLKKMRRMKSKRYFEDDGSTEYIDESDECRRNVRNASKRPRVSGSGDADWVEFGEEDEGRRHDTSDLYFPDCEVEIDADAIDFLEDGLWSTETAEICPTVNKKKSRGKEYPCKNCDQILNSNTGLRTHMRNVHGENPSQTCQYCHFDFEQCRVPPAEDDDTPVEFSFICTLKNCDCKKPFKTMQKLRSHHYSTCLDRQTKLDTPLVCQHCGKSFKGANYLRHHINTAHEKKFNFVCEVCAAGYQTKSKLLRHIQTAHTQERLFKCDHCPVSYKQKYHLKAHLLKHLGEKSFVCELCGKGFYEAFHLSQHKENVHAPEKIVPCPYCSKLFASKHYVHNHIYTFHIKRYVRTKKQQDNVDLNTVADLNDVTTDQNFVISQVTDDAVPVTEPCITKVESISYEVVPVVQ